MAPRPFPLPLRIGTDICRVERIAQIIKARDTTDPGQPLRRFLNRILTYPERVYFRQRFGNNDAIFRNLQNASAFLAGRFAAKEACRKACDHLDENTRGFHHIIILPVTRAGSNEHQSQRPESLILYEVLREVDYQKKIEAAEKAPFDVSTLNGQICEISISHDGDYANAVALVPSMKQTDSLSSNAPEEDH
ncbi:hypothetical protein E8E11_000288 [Didymella keratinophila]|nr:hypothetical protein E8E11_000288 [Didymella keratinophila]